MANQLAATFSNQREAQCTRIAQCANQQVFLATGMFLAEEGLACQAGDGFFVSGMLVPDVDAQAITRPD